MHTDFEYLLLSCCFCVIFFFTLQCLENTFKIKLISLQLESEAWGPDINMYKANRNGNHSLIGMFNFSDPGNNRQP